MITNDDGINAGGIAALVAAISPLADIVVVAPDRGNSGKSHSITVMQPLFSTPDNIFGNDIKAFKVSGTPVDCVKLGFYGLLSSKPDYILSGINHGSNSSSSVHYSGTLGAAREAAMLGVTGIGFSLLDYESDADFTQAAAIAAKVFTQIQNREIPQGTYLSVNIPKERAKGIKKCRIANGHWQEEAQKCTDPYGNDYYWMIGTFVNDEPQSTDTDEYWLSKGYATISPCQLDVTNYNTLDSLDFEI